MKKTSIFYFSLIILLLFTALANAAPVGKVTNMEGRVDVLKTGKNAAASVSIGDPVDVGDIYRAKSNSKAEITFNNKNLLRIASNTRLEIKEYTVEGDRSNGVAKLHRGKVQAVAAEDFIKKVAAFAEGNKFEIHTPNAVAGIRGTNMIVFHERGLTGVLFVTGKGYLYNPTVPEKVVPVTAGNISFITAPNAPPTPPIKASESQMNQQVNAVTITAKAATAKAETKPDEPTTTTATTTTATTTTTTTATTPTEVTAAAFSMPEVPMLPTVASTVLTKSGGLVQTGTGAFVQTGMMTTSGTGTTTIAGTTTTTLAGTTTTSSTTLEKTPPPVAQDTTPPTVTIIDKPAQLTNSKTANFYLSSDEPVTYIYSLDGGSSVSAANSFSISSLSEGNHAIYITAKDVVGNSTTTSYAWTTDYSPPAVVTTKTTTPAADNTTDVKIDFSATNKTDKPADYVTYQYKIDNSSWADAQGSSTLIPKVPDGAHTVEYKAIDKVGNETTDSLSFELKNYTAQSTVAGTGFTGAATTNFSIMTGQSSGTGQASGTEQSSGPYKTDMTIQTQGSSQPPTDINLGGSGSYWIETMRLNTTGNSLSGASRFAYISETNLATGTGTVAGSRTTAEGPWAVKSDGTFQSTLLKFFNPIGTSIDYNDYGVNRMDLIADGMIEAFMGGIQTLWTGSNIPFTILGKRYPDNTEFTVLNHYWPQDIAPYNARTDKDMTYDNGTYYGFLSGIDRGVSKLTEGRMYALYIDPDGKAGILKGSFGTGETEDPRGVLHPEIKMWEAGGTINRFQLNNNIGITPTTLPVEWYYTSDYIRFVEGPELMNNRSSKGLFFDANTNIVSYATSRGDMLWYASFMNDPDFGIWQMDSWGGYDKNKTTDKLILISDQRWGSEGDINRIFNINSRNTWGNEKISGSAIGVGGGFENNWTAIISGETLGTYNDSIGTFGAYTTGAWLETGRFLSMLDTASSDYAANKANLESLGFPTNKIAGTDLAGTLSGSQEASININNMRLFAKQTGDWPYILATAEKTGTTDGVSGTYSGSYLMDLGRIILTSSDETFYSKFALNKVGYSSAPSGTNNNKAPYNGGMEPGNWLADINGIGAILLDTGSYAQGTWSGVAAGKYSYVNQSSISFSGSTAGLFYPSTFISLIADTDPDNIAYLYAFNGTDYARDGYFKGIAGGDPIPLWKTTKSNPSTFDMIGLYIADSAVGIPQPPGGTQSATNYQDHVFGVQINPTNYVNPLKQYTTTDDGSYWGYIAGAHRGLSYGPTSGSTEWWNGPIEGSIGALYIDPQKNTGVLVGRFGGPDPDNPLNYKGYFDAQNKQWWADGKWYPVELGTTSILPEDLKTNISAASFDFSIQDSVGQFIDAPGSITMADIEKPLNSVSYWIADAPNMGIWVSGFFGNYTSTTPDAPAPNGWTFDIAGSAPETGKYTGIALTGGQTIDRRVEGTATGHWADIKTIMRDSYTGIMAGRVDGTFDPDKQIYQAVMVGSWLETNKLLELAADEAGRKKLQSLDIPSVVVGSATLTQQGANTYLSNVAINNAQFFSTVTGGKPTIWAAGGASGGVSGNYNGNPNNQSVALSGSGLSANFNMKAWDTTDNRWLSTITNGQGTLSGGSYTGSVNFKGVGAGTINQGAGSFSGTAAGISK